MTQPIPAGFEARPAPKLRVFSFTRWSGKREKVHATSVSFIGDSLVFRHGQRLVLAVKSGDWNNVSEQPEAGE